MIAARSNSSSSDVSSTRMLALATQILRRGGWAPALVFALHLVLSRGFETFASVALPAWESDADPLMRLTLEEGGQPTPIRAPRSRWWTPCDR